MSKGLLFITAFLFLSACTQTIEKYDSNGNLMATYEKKGGRFDGTSTWYYPNGKIRMTSEFKNGQLHGQTVSYSKTGKKESIETFQNGLKEGVSKIWFPNGKIKKTAHYLKDTLQGMYEEYYPNGQLQVKGYYTHGQYDSIWNWWYQSRIKSGEAFFDNGSGIQKTWYMNGKPQMRIPFVKSQKHGKAIYYNSSGEPFKYTWFENGLVIKDSLLSK